MLEDKANGQQIAASEIAAMRCIVEACARDFDVALEKT